MFFYFQFKTSSFFIEILSFGFCLVNFECNAYLIVDHSLVYSYPKTFLLLLSLILTAWAWFKTIFLDLYPWFIFVAPGSSWLQDWNSVINFPQLVSFVFPFFIRSKCMPVPGGNSYLSLTMTINLCLYRFLLICFYIAFIFGPTY